MLWYAHVHHVPVTPRIACEVWDGLFVNPPERSELLKKLYERMREQISRSQHIDGIGTGLSPQSFSLHTYINVILIWLQNVVERDDDVHWLFGDEGHAPAPEGFADIYDQYDVDIYQRMLEYLDSPAAEHFLFESAFSLAGMSRVLGAQQRKSQERRKKRDSNSDVPSFGESARLSLNDGDLVAVLNRSRPKIKFKSSPRHVRTMEQRVGKEPSASRIMQGGVEGIRQSRRLEDVPYQLPSEHLFDEDVWWNRILNDHFFTLDRPPKRKRHRDVLFVGLLPRFDNIGGLAALVKCAWFEAALQLLRILRRLGLEESDALWIEVEPSGRRGHFQTSLQPFIQSLPDMDDDKVHDQQRLQFIARMSWLPKFTSAMQNEYVGKDTENIEALFQTDKDIGSPDHASDWARKFHTLAKSGGATALASATNGRPDDYQFIHLVAAVPGVKADYTNYIIDGLRQTVRGDQGVVVNCSVLPINAHKHEEWVVSTGPAFRQEGRVEPEIRAGRAGHAEEIIGGLAGIWCDHLVQGIFHG